MNRERDYALIVFFSLLAVTCLLLSIQNPIRSAYAADDDPSHLQRAAVAHAYQIDRQTAAYRSAVSSADTDDSDAWGSIAEFGLNGRPNLFVSGRFSGAAADTATIKIAYYYKTTVDGTDTLNYKGSSSVVTLTALAGIDGNNDNESAIVGFDGRGSNMIKVIVLSISAGNIDLWVGSH